ncbi:MAG TPA: TIGR02147 family protein [Oligoflexus sp.]|uniref:TIGR02147 family protein n=1 Tax=Oligoflexus sp. TaxID=1971216 RepID=UPI002D660E13|nr:TIGR02147 family protein [Oligoflexus sp.]HYX37477.1 TIGR02147 family protein [Oligoflexus sp.]
MTVFSHIDHLGLVILNAATGSEAVQQSFAYRKAIDPKFSLAFVARKIAFKSRGTLSQMVHGKRSIPVRMRRPLLQSITGDDVLTEYMELLLALDDDLLVHQKTSVEQRLKAIQIYLRDRFTRIRLQQGLTLFASDILCAFDLFRGQPTERELINYFGRSRVQDIQHALGTLLANGLIRREGEILIRTEKTARFVTLNADDNSKVSYLKESISDAHEQILHWFPNTEVSCFGSTTMSVSKETYIKILKKLKQDVFRSFSDLETNHADTIIRFNMQIYPLRAWDHSPKT